MTERAPDPAERERWVVSFLVTGDHEGVQAVDAEHLIRMMLSDLPDGSQPLTSTLARFEDLSDAEQERWRRQLDREAEW